MKSLILWILTSILIILSKEVNFSNAIFLKSMFENWYNNNICQGTCQLAMTCWMNNGYTVQSQKCSSYIYSCCHYNHTLLAEENTISYAQPRKIRDGWDDLLTNSVEVLHELHFGSVRNDPICGLQRISRRRIVGGRAAGFGVYPWQAMVINQKSRCGGALIGRQHIVTAGHCVSNYTDSREIIDFTSKRQKMFQMIRKIALID